MNYIHSLLARVGRPGLILMFILVILAGGTQAHAQDAPEVPRLSIGPWTGTAYASGVATTSAQGFEFLYDGTIRANLEIDVKDETIIEGTWSHSGFANNLITGNVNGQEATLEADLTFSGPGSIGGSPEVLLLDGTSESTGTATISSSQGTFTNPAGNTSVVPTLEIKIRHAQCDEAYGDWIWALEQEFENQGFRAELDGSFMAVREETEIQDQLESLYQSFMGGPPPDKVESPLFDMIGEYISNVNAFTDQYPNWSMDTVMDALALGEFFLNELRNLRPCDVKFFGEENVELFANALTFQIQQLIVGGANLDDVDGTDVLQLMEVATRVGAFGPGAPNPAQAVEAEEVLRKAAQNILEANLDPEDNQIVANEDAVKAMLTGAIMDWTFLVGGEEYKARETYGTIGQDWQADAGQAGGDS